jgi:HEAT repeat protein
LRRITAGTLACFCALGLALIGLCQADSVGQMIANLSSPDASTRKNAADALGQIKDPRAVKPLIVALKADRNPLVRTSAAKALGEIGTPAVEPLIAALKEKDAEVRWRAVVNLGKIKDTRAVEPLIASLKSDRDERVRREAAEALDQIKDSRATEPLIAALKDKDFEVRANAARGLGRGDAPRAFEALLAALTGDKDPSVRISAAEALGETRDPRAIEPLIAAMKTELKLPLRSNDELGSSAAEALSEIGAPSVEPLIAALRLGDPKVRLHAAFALCRVRDPRAIEPLIVALKDSDGMIQMQATLALASIGRSKISLSDNFCADNQAHAGWIAAQILGVISDPRVVSALFEARNQHDTEVVARAYVFFIERGQPESEGPLIAALSEFGDEGMADDFLNSGNENLAEAARRWARSHGFSIAPVGETRSVQWGSKR